MCIQELNPPSPQNGNINIAGSVTTNGGAINSGFVYTNVGGSTWDSQYGEWVPMWPYGIVSYNNSCGGCNPV